jgi:hypothetical protein
MIRRDRAAAGGRGNGLNRKLLHGGLITALAVALVATGSGITFALWTSAAEVTSQATTAKLTLTAENFTNVSAVFKNHSLSATGSFTVTNETLSSSSAVGQLNVVLDAPGGAAQLKNNLNVSVWGPVSSTAVCTPAATPSGVNNISGSWATLTPLTTTLTVGESKTWCVRSQAALRDDLASSAGSLSIQPRITATMTVGSWTATAVKQAAQLTQYIYPDWAPNPLVWYQIRNVSSSSCVDVEGDVNANGTLVIDYGCKSGTAAETYNQQWRFSAGAGDYFQVMSRNSPNLRLDTQSTALNASAQTNTSSGLDRQQWQLQATSGTEYQLVNKQTGYCLTTSGSTPTGNTAYAAAECNGNSSQRFTLTVKETQIPALASISCAPEGSGATQRVRYSWSASTPAIGNYLFQAQLPSGWTTVGTAASGSTSIVIDPAVPHALWSAADNTYNVRIRASNDSITLAATSALWKGVTPSGPGYLACSRPAASAAGLACVSVPNGVAYSWSTLAVGQYDFQARQGTTGNNWYTIGSAATGSTSATFTATPPTQLTSGIKQLRVVVNGTTTNIAPVGWEVWKGVVTSGGSAVLSCSTPTASISALTCTNTGTTPSNYSVTLGWAQPAVDAYTINVRRTATANFPIGSPAIGATSHTVATVPTNNFADGTYTVQVLYGSTVLVESTLVKAGGNGNNRHWRCPAVVPPTVTAVCANAGGVTISWATVTTAASTVTFSYAGAPMATKAVTHNSPSAGRSSVVLANSEIPAGTPNGVYALNLELISGGATVAYPTDQTVAVTNGSLSCG